MDTKITQEDILKFIYSETTKQENKHILDELLVNDDLRSYYKDTLTLLSQLDTLKTSPNDTTLKILNEIASHSSLEAI